MPAFGGPQIYHTFAGHGGYYHGPPAPLAHDGQVIDTPEVVHAKKAHLSAHAEETAKAGHSGFNIGDEYSHGNFDNVHHVPYHNVYHGPPAPLGHDGRVIDTPEVAHAKAAHLAAHAEQIAKIAHVPHHDPYPHAIW